MVAACKLVAKSKVAIAVTAVWDVMDFPLFGG
jgi:hypothetical protein